MSFSDPRNDKYGVFAHRGDGRYRWEDRINKRDWVMPHAAQNFADKMNTIVWREDFNNMGYVVRHFKWTMDYKPDFGDKMQSGL